MSAPAARSAQWVPLHFGQLQLSVLIVFGVLALGIVGVFVLVAAQARRELPFETVRERGYALRRYWLGLLVGMGVAVVGTSMFFMPYAKGSSRVVAVTVIAGQFYWSALPDRVSAGSTVIFDVTSSDVNHGLGIYDPEGQMLGTVQAMPGYHNRLELTLDKRGTYLFGCLEFCGIGHAHMLRTFEVT